MKLYKYADKIYEGRWKVLKRVKNHYILENIYNHNQIEICEKTLLKIERKQTTVSYVVFQKMFRQGKANRFKW